MARRVVSFIFPLVCAVAVMAQNTPAGTSDWKTYRNQQSGFELRYPPEWKVSEGLGTGSQMITISGPRSPGAPQVSLTVAVQKDQNPKKLSIEAWFAEQLKRMNAKPESQGSTLVGGEPAVFMENANSFGRRHAVYTALHGIDILTFIYEPGTKFDSTYAAILESFHSL